jgi:hypothetical protein
MATTASADTLALQRLYHWEKTTPDRVAFTQPTGGGATVDITWREAVDQARRMAAHLQSLGIGPATTSALISKNTAHWMMSTGPSGWPARSRCRCTPRWPPAPSARSSSTAAPSCCSWASSTAGRA